MPASEEVQALVRFLAQDSKLPLPLAINTAKILREAKLSNADEVSKCDLTTLETVVGNQKDAKKIWNAAKRSVKKRRAGEDTGSPSSKKTKMSTPGPEAAPSQIEAALALPVQVDTEEISKTVVVTNRAPLVLAFAVTVTKYTMPEQPLSSRLSLAQAVVSANSRTKAGSLGIVTGASAEEEGWGGGQPTVKVLGRNIKVLKRYGYSSKEVQRETSPEGEGKDNDTASEGFETTPALWGLDLEALRGSSRPPSQGTSGGQNSVLPIYRPESARDYLLKSFSIYKPDGPGSATKGKTKGKSSAGSPFDKEKSLGLLLGAIDELCRSWASTLAGDELDRRAWSWYVKVRPDVQDGVSGWGQKGPVFLRNILDMEKQT